MNGMRAAYLNLLESGELEERAKEAWARLESCVTCAWECKINRLAGKHGICELGAKAYVSSYGPHLGEEDPLRGWRGSGTIFFSRCNMRCQFCQNHDISQAKAGYAVSDTQLAQIMLELQEMGCHNINLVSPSHVVPQILAALLVAARAGLELPIVYNTGGYDSIGTLKLLDGVIDIYMPDMKYASEKIARIYSRIPHYPQTNQAAVLEMHRQVGDMQIDRRGIATRGLLVRHLVLPNDLAGTEEIVRFLADKVSTNTYLNIMSQYRPSYKAHQFPKLNRPLKGDEYRRAVQMALAAGIKRLD
jgi:putative pyruvate formate lyase activating enzyme